MKRLVALVTLVLALFMPAAALADGCQFVLGFADMAAAVPQVGQCKEDQHFAANGDAQQATTGGLLVWRKSDNWTAFTDGYHTWLNGPQGLQERLNTDLFDWEIPPVPNYQGNPPRSCTRLNLPEMPPNTRAGSCLYQTGYALWELKPGQWVALGTISLAGDQAQFTDEGKYVFPKEAAQLQAQQAQQQAQAKAAADAEHTQVMLTLLSALAQRRSATTTTDCSYNGLPIGSPGSGFSCTRF